MRRIFSTKDPDELKNICSILDQAKITYNIDRTTISDWASEQYGDLVFSLWVIEDDDVIRAKTILSQEPMQEDPLPKEPPPSSPSSKRPFLTLVIFFTCVTLFLLDIGSASLAPASTYSSVTTFYPFRQWLLFDYPSAIELEDTLIAKEAASSLSYEDEQALHALNTSSYWGGVSLSLFARIARLSLVPEPTFDPHLLFEKMLQGQFWRLFTPALLHGSLLHLLFNMAWLYILGRQIEERIGVSRYLLFIVLSGIITNISQYLMSGYAFLGFSGILLAMASFIMTRMRLFPNEGFFLEKALYTFLKVMVAASVVFSLVLFGIECFLHRPLFSTGFANTAHVMGLLSGIFLGKLRFFSSHKIQIYPQN